MVAWPFRETEDMTSGRTSDDVPFLFDEEKDGLGASHTSNIRNRWANWLPYSVVLNIILVAAVLVNWVVARPDQRKAYIPNEIYSPAQDVVEYENILFTGGLQGETSPYMGSSHEVDAEWDKLYQGAVISKIDAEQASKLANATTPFHDDPSQYIVVVDVFHQLHCLNMMRMLVYPDVYKKVLTPGTEAGDENIIHFEHCYEQLRQSLQCHSDIGTIFWEWSEKKQRLLGNAHTLHTCKNFEKIRQWGLEHRPKTEMDMSIKVEGVPIYKEGGV